MLTQEQLRDPAYAFEVGRDFTHLVGVDINPLDAPDAFAEAMHKKNPRTPNSLVRLQLEESTTEWPGEAATMITKTATELGIKEPEYPFDLDGEYDAIVVSGGARDAIPDRTSFALTAIERGVKTPELLVVGTDSRALDDRERPAVVKWAPDAETELDLARATVQNLRKANNPLIKPIGDVVLSTFPVYVYKPDQRDVTNEVILRKLDFDEDGRKMGNLAIVTTALYVPFKTHETLAVAKRFGVDIEMAGVASRPENTANRTLDQYVSEIARTLNAAAHHQAVINRLK